MKYRKKKIIEDYFGVSIIMPFYKRLKDFKKVFPNNSSYFQRNGVEVIIVMDESSEENKLLEFIAFYPFINFKVMVNKNTHPWRNPCKVLNVGIRNASFEYILILDPEVELLTDIVCQLRYTLFHYPESYATGMVAFIDHKTDVERLLNPDWLSYGSIMAKREHFMNLRGYDESFKEWGGEDDQIRRRLELYGLSKIELLDAKAVHREENSVGHRERYKRIKEMPLKHLKHIFYPKKLIFNDELWGYDFKHIVWDWKIDKNFEQLKKYLSQFCEYKIFDKKTLQRNHQIVALIQIHNESNNVRGVLSHLETYCDGIILLDDGSTDGSFELANHQKF